VIVCSTTRACNFLSSKFPDAKWWSSRASAGLPRMQCFFDTSNVSQVSNSLRTLPYCLTEDDCGDTITQQTQDTSPLAWLPSSMTAHLPSPLLAPPTLRCAHARASACCPPQLPCSHNATFLKLIGMQKPAATYSHAAACK